MAEDLQERVERYLSDPSTAHREAVVLGGAPLVRSLIGKLSIPDHPLASHEDLENVGIVGLLEALDNYDPEKARFITHAYWRIRGALIDYLRSIDVLSRGKRQRLAEAREAIEALRQLMGTEPRDTDVADYLDVSLPRYLGLLSEAQHRFSLSLFTPLGDEAGAQTMLDVLPHEEATAGFDDVEQQSTIDAVDKLLRHLPERQQTIVSLYYMEDLTLREIGDVLGLSEGRISQLLGKILLTLRAGMTEGHPSAA